MKCKKDGGTCGYGGMCDECDEVGLSAVEPIVSWLEVPDSQGHWEKLDGCESSRWDVYFRDWRGAQHPFATNENQTDPCVWLTGRWRKISNEYCGRMAS